MVKHGELVSPTIWEKKNRAPEREKTKSRGPQGLIYFGGIENRTQIRSELLSDLRQTTTIYADHY